MVGLRILNISKTYSQLRKTDLISLNARRWIQSILAFYVIITIFVLIYFEG